MPRQSRYMEHAKLAFRVKGSVLYNSIPIASCSALVSLFAMMLRKNMIFFLGSWWSAAIIHPLAVQVFGIVVALLVTNRVAAAVNRWWTSMNAVSLMLHKWHDAESLIMSGLKKDMRDLSLQLQRSGMDIQSRTSEAQKLQLMRILREKLVHWFSLLNAIALSTFKYGESTALDNTYCKVPFFTWLSKDEPKTKRQCGVEKLKQKMSEGIYADQMVNPDVERLHYIGELSVEERVQLESAEEKVTLVGQWLTEALVLADFEGLLKLSPTLAAQTHTRIAEGLQAYNDAYTLAAIPYPFPIAQVTNVIMMFAVMLFPIMIEKFTQAMILTPVLSFMMTLTFWSLNGVALELENPFGDGVNDLPLKELCDMYLDRMMEAVKSSFVDQDGSNSVHAYSPMFTGTGCLTMSEQPNDEAQPQQEETDMVPVLSDGTCHSCESLTDPEIIDVETGLYNLDILPHPVRLRSQPIYQPVFLSQPRRPQTVVRPLWSSEAPIVRHACPPEHQYRDQWLIDRAKAKIAKGAVESQRGFPEPTNATKSSPRSDGDEQMMEEAEGDIGGESRSRSRDPGEDIRHPPPPGRQRSQGLGHPSSTLSGKHRRPGSAPPTRSIFNHPASIRSIPEYGVCVDAPDYVPVDFMLSQGFAQPNQAFGPSIIATPNQAPVSQFGPGMPLSQFSFVPSHPGIPYSDEALYENDELH